MRKKYFLNFCVSVMAVFSFLNFAYGQTTPPATPPANAPAAPQVAAPVKPMPAKVVGAAAATKTAIPASGDATKKAKILPKAPVALKPEHISDLQERSKGKYNIWFSNLVKSNYTNYPYKKSFLAWPRIHEVNRGAVPICKQQFNELCGAEDYPVAENFVFCLQKNYEKLRANQNCAVLAHYLIHMNFNRYLAFNTEPCKAKFEACFKSTDKTLAPAQCVLTQQDLSPMCYKLTVDALKLRGYASRVYDAKFACTSPESCK